MFLIISPSTGSKAELVRASQLLSLVGRKKRNKESRGPAITRAGAGLIPVGEVSTHVIKPGSGHPASLSNYTGQILYAGEPTTRRSRVIRGGNNEEEAEESEQDVEPDQTEQTEDSARTVSESRSLVRGLFQFL